MSWEAPDGLKNEKRPVSSFLMSLTGVRGGDGLGEDAVGDGAQRAEGKNQWHRNDAVVPHGPHQGLRDRTKQTTDH